MKTFLVLVLSVTALFVWQRQSNVDMTAAKPPRIETRVAPAVTPRPVSEHDWAKNSLDRTHEVIDQVQQSREQNDQR